MSVRQTLLLAIALLIFLPLFFFTKQDIHAIWILDSQHRIRYVPEGDVLGKEVKGKDDEGKDEDETEKDEDRDEELGDEENDEGKDSSKSTGTDDDSRGPSDRGKDGDADSSSSSSSSGSEHDEDEDAEEFEFEVRAEGEVTEMRAKDVSSRVKKIEVKQAGDKVHFKLEEDDEEFDEFESTPSAEIQIEESADKNKITVRARNSAFEILRNRVRARTNFPLSVDTQTNELIVTTPAGSKRVTVLPDQAVENMLANNVLSEVGGSQVTDIPVDVSETDDNGGGFFDDDNSAPSGEPAGTPSATPVSEPEEDTGEESSVDLEVEEDGTLAYKIEGKKSARLLGLFDVSLDRTAVVSAETGELIRVQQDFVTLILDFLSI